MRIARPLTILCIILVLSACSTGREHGGNATQAVAFSSSSDKAVVMVGQRSTTDDLRTSIFGDTKATWVQTWIEFDPETKETLRPERDYRDNRGLFRVFRTHCTPFAPAYDKLTCDWDRRRPHYAAYVIKPGHYILKGVGLLQGGGTTFTNERESVLFDDSIAARVRDSSVPWFYARAGEIVYVGTLVLDIRNAINNVDGDVKLVGVERDDEAAREAMQYFPNIKGELIYRGIELPVTGASLTEIEQAQR